MNDSLVEAVTKALGVVKSSWSAVEAARTSILNAVQMSLEESCALPLWVDEVNGESSARGNAASIRTPFDFAETALTPGGAP